MTDAAAVRHENEQRSSRPPGSLLSSHAVMTYGRAIHALRRFTQDSLNNEPAWRQRAPPHGSEKA